MKNFKRSKKALSPVVASIILIAVTVAVSIAVAAWMGALVFNQMKTENVKISGVQFATSPSKAVVISVLNTGTDGVTINEVSINGGSYTSVSNLPLTIDANSPGTVTVTYGWELGSSYQIDVITAQGNHFAYTAVA
jgi:flagellin-like protein